jgi:hypothetical protein
MAVPVTELEGLDPTGASLQSIADHAGTGPGESGVAILFPDPIQRFESRRREGVPRSVEPLVEVVAARRCGMRSNLLEVPAQFVQRLGPERRQQLVPHDLFLTLGDVRELWWHHDPERPCG